MGTSKEREMAIRTRLAQMGQGPQELGAGAGEEVNAEQNEDFAAIFNAVGVEIEKASDDDDGEREDVEEEAEVGSGDLVEVQRTVPAKAEAKEPIERTDDPVRMYLREMGSMELLSREGEVAIAKR